MDFCESARCLRLEAELTCPNLRNYGLPFQEVQAEGARSDRYRGTIEFDSNLPCAHSLDQELSQVLVVRRGPIFRGPSSKPIIRLRHRPLMASVVFCKEAVTANKWKGVSAEGRSLSRRRSFRPLGGRPVSSARRRSIGAALALDGPFPLGSPSPISQRHQPPAFRRLLWCMISISRAKRFTRRMLSVKRIAGA